MTTITLRECAICRSTVARGNCRHIQESLDTVLMSRLAYDDLLGRMLRAERAADGNQELADAVLAIKRFLEESP